MAKNTFLTNEDYGQCYNQKTMNKSNRNQSPQETLVFGDKEKNLLKKTKTSRD